MDILTARGRNSSFRPTTCCDHLSCKCTIWVPEGFTACRGPGPGPPGWGGYYSGGPQDGAVDDKELQGQAEVRPRSEVSWAAAVPSCSLASQLLTGSGKSGFCEVTKGLEWVGGGTTQPACQMLAPPSCSRPLPNVWKLQQMRL